MILLVLDDLDSFRFNPGILEIVPLLEFDTFLTIKLGYRFRRICVIKKYIWSLSPIPSTKLLNSWNFLSDMNFRISTEPLSIISKFMLMRW